MAHGRKDSRSAATEGYRRATAAAPIAGTPTKPASGGRPPTPAYDEAVTDPPDDPTARVARAAGDPPPRRLLERAPSERFAQAASDARPPQAGAAALASARQATARPAAGRGTPGRGLGLGASAAAVGAAVHLGAAVLLLWTAGLVMVAVTLGIAAGLAVAEGAGASITPAARRAGAVGLALLALAAAIGADWALSGMYLGPLDYLAQVYGFLVPLQVAGAAAGALAGSR